MQVRDPIYGDIEFDKTELSLLDQPEMQRLRYIRQTGFAHLVYLGANHTRFEHSIGTMEATKELSKSIGKDRPELYYAGLLHDIGHGPFSHISEPVISKYLKKTHEQLGREIVASTGIREIISDSSASLGKVIAYFTKEDKYSIISGAIGSDRIDYLLRDSYYTGVAYGVIDYSRIKSKIAEYKGKTAIYEQGISAAESLLIARLFMFRNVYLHHTCIIAGEMFAKAAERAIEEGALDPKNFAKMRDDEALAALMNAMDSREIVERIYARRLYKRAYNGETEGSIAKEIESELSRNGFDSMDYIVREYKLEPFKEDIPVLDKKGNYIGKLSKISLLVGMLANPSNTKSMLIVATKPELVEKAKRIIEKIIDR